MFKLSNLFYKIKKNTPVFMIGCSLKKKTEYFTTIFFFYRILDIIPNISYLSVSVLK